MGEIVFPVAIWGVVWENVSSPVNILFIIS